MTARYLLIKHSQGWNVDRCCLWMERQGQAFDWCYPDSGQPLPDPQAYAGVIVFGGATSANDCGEHQWVRSELDFIERCVQLNKPFFGICLGAQMLARVLGSDIRSHSKGIKEIGFFRIDPTPCAGDFLPDPLHVMQWHSEGFDLPDGCTNLAYSEHFPNQAFALNDRIQGVQFHPEVNPAALAIWIERNKKRKPDMLCDTYRQRMLDDAQRFDSANSVWLDNFLDRWTGQTSQAA